jgi:hypothetical protein
MREEHHLHVKMAEWHHLKWFSRQGNGYPGTNRIWALIYCQYQHSLGGNRTAAGCNGEPMVLCPHKAYCLGGIRNPVLGYPIITSPYHNHKLTSGSHLWLQPKIFFVRKLFCYQYHSVALP